MTEASNGPLAATTPEPTQLAEIRLALLGIGAADASIDVAAEVAAAAAESGRLTVTDPEGAPVATVTVSASPAPADAPGTATVTGRIDAAHPPERQRSAGPFSFFRLGPSQARFDGWSAIVGHDPPDTYALQAADPARPLLFVVLDGPRTHPGPEPALTVRAVLNLRNELRADGRTAEIVIVPAPQYGDHRDDSLTSVIAEAFGAEPVRPARRADHAALHDGLDGRDRLPTEEWPRSSLDAWRRWRPPRDERGLVLLLTGLSGSGKSTIARAVVDRLSEFTDRTITLLDGDLVRRNLSAGLGFSRADRDRNIERIGFVAAEIARHGGIAVCAPIAPFAASRERVRAMAAAHSDFLLVHVATPVEECERRDRKGLYARARAGEIAEFTGISSPYEEPVDADLVLDTTEVAIDDAREAVLDLLAAGGWISHLVGPWTEPSRRVRLT